MPEICSPKIRIRTEFKKTPLFNISDRWLSLQQKLAISRKFQTISSQAVFIENPAFEARPTDLRGAKEFDRRKQSCVSDF